MGKHIKKGLMIIFQVLFLYMVYYLGNIIERLADIPVPGSILGMIILFLCLEGGLLPLAYVREGANLLIKHLNLLFIPVAVGIILWGDLIKTSGLKIFFILLVTTFFGVVVTGLLANTFLTKMEED